MEVEVERIQVLFSPRKSQESSLGILYRGALCLEQPSQDAFQVQVTAEMTPLSAGGTPPLPSPRVLGLTTLGGNLCPGRYLTFSCCVLMISVSFFPPMSSSNTHMVTRGSKCDSWAALPPTILAIAEPLVGGRAQKVEESGQEGGTVAGEGATLHLRMAPQPTRLFACHLPYDLDHHHESASLAVERRLSLSYTLQLEKGNSLQPPSPKQLFRQRGLWKLPSCGEQVQLPRQARARKRFGHHLSCGGGTEIGGHFLPSVCLLPTKPLPNPLCTWGNLPFPPHT